MLEAAGAAEGVQPEFNFEYVDDGSSSSAEFMNLLVRSNLLFKVVSRPDSNGALQVGLGLPDFPKSEAGNPKLLAEKASQSDRRETATAYLRELRSDWTAPGERHAGAIISLNYGAEKAEVDGVRIRVLVNTGDTKSGSTIVRRLSWGITVRTREQRNLPWPSYRCLP